MKKLVSICLGIMLFVSSVSVSNADENINISRVSGWDRYETTVNANKKYMNSANGKLAVIASGNDFRTALYGSYMASSLKVPYFVNPKHGLRTDILNELKRLNVNRVYIMGDYNVLDKSVDNTLKSKGVKVERFYDSAEYYDEIEGKVDGKIFSTFFPNGSRCDNVGILINDLKFPDLLSSIPFLSESIRSQETYLMGMKSVYNREYSDIEYLKNPHNWQYIIGGFNSVSGKFSTHDQYQGGLVYNDGYYSGRIYGSNRYKTSVEIAKAYETVFNKRVKTVVLVNGEDYPDALSSSLVATQNDGVVLLTQPNRLNEDTANYIKNNDIKNVIIVGGEKSVSKNVENELKSLKINEEKAEDRDSAYEINGRKFDRNGIPIDILGEVDLSNVEYSVDFDKDYDLDGFR
ncbi:MAG: cell wall-binding repeat-containing protein [Peptostreptococcus sp.]|uniref:cell wall-binding repeat-containing protein n=1 Tax=Peptostreptococcus sp. TaxID=1262 RepID=UPI002FC8E044